jgi:hypothetical protein
MRVIERKEGLQKQIDAAIERLKCELDIERTYPIPSGDRVSSTLEGKILTLEGINLELPLTAFQRDVLNDEIVGFMCEECCSQIRSKLLELGSDNLIFYVCFVCLERALDNKDNPRKF